MDRRTFLLTALAAPFAMHTVTGASPAPARDAADRALAELERGFDGRLGVCALDAAPRAAPGVGAELAWRADERFPMCSTFKVILAAAVLQRSESDGDLLHQRIRYTREDLVTWSPITEKHLDAGMTVADLCAAALQHSDNTAANLLLRLLGGDDGPAALTAFARSIGDETFRLDRWETELNSALPGDPRDTTTPRAMVRSLQHLLLGDVLHEESRGQLRDWMLGNTTGGARIRAGVPADWLVGDKTGTGDYGTANDVAFLEPPAGPAGGPILLAIYTTRATEDAEPANELIAAAARIAATWARRA